MPRYDVRQASTTGVQCQTCGKAIKHGLQFGINGSKWRHLPDCIGDKVKKEVRGYENDKNITQKDLKGFEILSASDKYLVIKVFEFDKPFERVSFKKKVRVDWHGEQATGGGRNPDLTERATPDERRGWQDDESTALSGSKQPGWAETSSQSNQPRGRTTAYSGGGRSSQTLPGSSQSSHTRSSHSLASRTSNNNPNERQEQYIMPSRAAWKKGRVERPSRQRTSITVERRVFPTPPDDIGGSWGDAAPTWGDTEPSWGYTGPGSGDTGSSPAKEKSPKSVWDNPAPESETRCNQPAECSAWGTEAQLQRPITPEEDGAPGDVYQEQQEAEWGGGQEDGAVAWGDEELLAWGQPEDDSRHEHKRKSEDDGWFGAQNQGQNWNEEWNEEVPVSWEDGEIEDGAPDGKHDDTCKVSPVASPINFQLNPGASVFVPKSLAPVAVKAEPEDSSPSVQHPLSVNASVQPTPSTVDRSLTNQSPYNSQNLSTPATSPRDGDGVAEDATLELEKMDLEVAEQKLGVSQAHLEMMRRKLDVLEKKRALLAAAARGRK